MQRAQGTCLNVLWHTAASNGAELPLQSPRILPGSCSPACEQMCPAARPTAASGAAHADPAGAQAHLIAALLQPLLTILALSFIAVQKQHPEPTGETGALAEAGAALDTHCYAEVGWVWDRLMGSSLWDAGKVKQLINQPTVQPLNAALRVLCKPGVQLARGLCSTRSRAAMAATVSHCCQVQAWETCQLCPIQQ